jgi:hypothetical protein
MPHWLDDGEMIGVADAPTVFGQPFGYRLTHQRNTRRVQINITQPTPPHVRLVYPCRFGAGVESATAHGASVPVRGRDVQLPAGTTQATVVYQV